MNRIWIKQCNTCQYTKECNGILINGPVPDDLECLDYEPVEEKEIKE